MKKLSLACMSIVKNQSLKSKSIGGGSLEAYSLALESFNATSAQINHPTSLANIGEKYTFVHY
jgi:hypothetical protein